MIDLASLKAVQVLKETHHGGDEFPVSHVSQVSYDRPAFLQILSYVIISCELHVAMHPALACRYGFKAFHYLTQELVVETAFGPVQPFFVFLGERERKIILYNLFAVSQRRADIHQQPYDIGKQIQERHGQQ